MSARRDARRHPPPGQMVDVGGFHMHLHCTGSGSPVIVLDAGLGDAGLVWAKVQAQLSASQRVCSYDRAGIAWSEPAIASSTRQDAAADLYALLQAAGEPPPYVLVGHSAGANHVRLFAHAYPEAVAGLVLIEPPLMTEVSPLFVSAVVAIRQTLGALARVGVIRVLGQTGQMGILFGGVAPPQALAHRAGFLYRPRSIAAHAGSAPNPTVMSALTQLANLSERGQVLTVQGSHFVHSEHPETVVAAILAIAKK